MSDLIDIIGGISLVGGAYFGVSYLAGKWPFTRIKENVYEITRWFTGHKGPALKGPRTAFYISPIVKKVIDEKGNVEIVSGRIRDRDSSLHFRTNDNFEGDQTIQYNYLIPDEKSAKKFYWDVGKDITLIDEIVHSRIAQEIGKRGADNLPKEQLGFLKEVQEKLGEIDKDNLVYKKYGVIVTNIVSGTLDFDKESQRKLSIVQEEKKDAEAREIRAESQAKEAKIQAESTESRTDKYLEAARKYSKAGSNMSVGDIALELQRRDNNESIAGKENINAIFSVPLNYQNMPPIVMPPKKKKEDNYENPPEPENSEVDNSGEQNKLGEKTLESEINSEQPKKALEDLLGK